MQLFQDLIFLIYAAGVPFRQGKNMKMVRTLINLKNVLLKDLFTSGGVIIELKLYFTFLTYNIYIM